MQLKYIKSVNEITHTHTQYDEVEIGMEDALHSDFNLISLELMWYKVHFFS